MLISVLGFHVNLSGDRLFPNIKRWELSTVQVVGKGKSVSWGCARTKFEVHECKITKNMLFQSDLLQLCMSENGR